MFRLLLLSAFLLMIGGCKKEKSIQSNIITSNQFNDSLIRYVQSRLSINDFQSLDLSNLETLKYDGKKIGMKIFEKNGLGKRFIISGVIGNSYVTNWVDMSGLTVAKTNRRVNGRMILQSTDKKLKTTVVISDSKVADVIVDGRSRIPDYVSPELPEIIIYYDVTNGYVDDGGGAMFTSLYWMFDQQSYYSGYYYSGSDYGGSTRTGPSTTDRDNVDIAPTINSPDNPITDIQREMGCFTNNGTSTYEITVNVNQPNPNSREVFNPLATFTVGHVFLTFQQRNADGSAIVRSVGFYPKGAVKPAASVDESVFGDDSNTPYDVALSISVSASDFNTVVSAVENERNSSYDLNSFNCTSAPMRALQSINVNLPSTKSVQLMFYGNDPADLGEDIRSMDLNNFSAENGNRKMKRVASNFNDQKPPAKQGGC